MFSEADFQLFEEFQKDWNKFAYDWLKLRLDSDQEHALFTIQNNPKTSICSGTSRGKDYLMAAAAICFLYLTPEWDDDGRLSGNTKVVLSAPTGRQVKDIMRPEISRIFNNSKYLPGSLIGNDIRTPFQEWFLTGFKADETNTEAWTGFHAANIFFGVTEATGMAEKVFDAIEGNLQGNSRLVIVFNPNINHGYAASSFRSPAFKKIRMNSLNAPNVVAKKIIHPGQVDYPWLVGKIRDWCIKTDRSQYNELEGDFEFEGTWYRPNDLFRAKVLALFPKVSEGVLVPPEWIELANKRWLDEKNKQKIKDEKNLRLGGDIAGMGRDNSCLAYRFGNLVEKFETKSGGGTANHMEVAGNILVILKQHTDVYNGRYAQAFLDTIGEGAGTYSRLEELKQDPKNIWLYVHSCKFSEAAMDVGAPRKDLTGQYEFLNMRAWSYWAVRDWLDPRNNSNAMLPPDDELFQEMTETKWKFRSDGKIQIEDKDELKKRIKRSPDKFDALANTFWPVPDVDVRPKKKQNLAQFFR